MGTVREQLIDGALQIGEQVVFIVYNHPRCVSSVCLEADLLFKWNGDLAKEDKIIKWFFAPKEWPRLYLLTKLAECFFLWVTYPRYQ